MSTDQAIEAEIQAKGLTAARVTPSDIEANIVGEHYFTAADGVDGASMRVHRSRAGDLPQSLDLLTFCVIILRNGFTVTGESACASPENFDEEIGRKIARQNAVNKIWPLLGFRLRDQLANGVRTEHPPRYRSAETGEFVTQDFAEANPATTIKES